MKLDWSRRDFLKLGGLALGALGARTLHAQSWSQAAQDVQPAYRPDFPRQPEYDQGILARVATKQVDIRSLPNDEASIVGIRQTTAGLGNVSDGPIH